MRDFQQALQILRLFFVQIDKLHTKSETVTMVPDFTFKIKPFIVRQQHAKRDDLSNHHLAYSVQIAAAFGKIGNAGRVALFATLPNRVEMYAQPGFRAPFIHGPEAIIEFLLKRAKRNLDTTDAKSCGNDLERRRKSSRKFAINFQIDPRVALGGAHDDFPC